ncbi:GNAT superfamily N-acetyltransferase [Filimonas zeae]|uniref:N-acetyltransferase n=1 Tax=Filimonas zeae TaxID=1737353 RepID=A0A917J3Y8_9BACT|nr:GNAT family N-acetyltransferase [Filimonas zeae]MDR6342160.1 GNAT superfamily N-acetyltransferase [Filimonas zeae]GGH78872.1 N-acetyltransferase [Filimonas zeae]
MSITIRRAEQADCPRLMELVRELALYEKAPGEVTVTLEHFVESGFGPSPVWWAIVAETAVSETEKNVVGFALYYIRYSTWKGQRMYLEDLLVTQEWRGKGIGSLLFQQLFQEARERQLKAVSWQVLDWNEPAINFYKKLNASFDGEWINCAVNV